MRSISRLVFPLSFLFIGCMTSEEADGTQQVLTAVRQINCGGNAVESFASDQSFTGGGAATYPGAVSTAGVSNAAPAAVYESERWGNHSYVLGELTANATYTVRLHFAEVYWSSAGARVFNVAINGARVLTNLDIFALVGARRALVRDFTATADAQGKITVQYSNLVDGAKSSAIEILSAGTSSNHAPTVQTASSGSPNPATGSSAALSVLGADDGGEANLTYAWAATSNPPAAVTFSVNGTNAAKNTIATFSKAGTYTLSATIADRFAATVSSSTNVKSMQAIHALPL